MNNDRERLLIAGSVKSRFKYLITDSFVYGGATALNAVSMIAVVPILTHSFSIQEYGQIDFYLTLITLMLVSVVFGQDSAVARFYYDSTEAQNRRDVVISSLSVQVIFIIVLLPGLLILPAIIPDWGLLRGTGSEVYYLVVAHIPFMAMSNFSQNILKWTFRRNAFLFMSIGSNLLTLLSVCIAVYAFETSMSGLFGSLLVVRITFGILGLLLIREYLFIPGPSVFKLFKPLLKFAVPFGFIATANCFLPVFERAVIADMLSEESLGQYALAAKVALFMAIPMQAFQVAWGPFSYSIFKQADADITFQYVLKYFSAVFFVLLMLLGIVIHQLVGLMGGENYYYSATIAMVLTLGIFCQGVGQITELGISISKRSHLKIYAYSLSTLTSIFSILALAELFGLLGVALGVVLGKFVKTLVETILAHHAHKIEWGYTGAILPFGLSLLAVFLSISFDQTGASYIVLLVVYLLLFWSLLMSSTEKKQATGLVFKS